MMIKYAAIMVQEYHESLLILQRVVIHMSTPAGQCSSRISYGSVTDPKSATCVSKPRHNEIHAYREDKRPDLNIAKKAVLKKHKGAKFIGWFDNTQTLCNSSDVNLTHDGRKYVRG